MGLKELRTAKGITGIQLVKELGVSERSIIRWEKEGLRNASFKHVVKISQLFEVDLNELGNRSEING